jgi:anti-sigma regulatory factor (Ser/Thr protein kinase)
MPAGVATSMTIDAAAGEVATALRFVHETCRRLGADPGECQALELAVEEVCTNLITYGYGGRGGPIAIDIARMRGERQGHDLVVTIRDRSPAFHPEAAPLPDLESGLDTRRAGGLGWHLVKALTDELRYDTEGDFNRLTLVKHLAQ